MIYYLPICSRCNTAKALKHGLMWEDEDELYYENGGLISAEDMEEKIQERYTYSGDNCEYCGHSQFVFSHFQIGERSLLSAANANFSFYVGYKYISYNPYRFVLIFEDVERKFDLSLKHYLGSTHDKQIGYSMSMQMLIYVLELAYEYDIYDIENEDEYYNYINYFLNSKINRDYLDLLDIEINPQYHNIHNQGLIYLYGEDINNHNLDQVRKYLLQQYKAAFEYILREVDKIFLFQGIPKSDIFTR